MWPTNGNGLMAWVWAIGSTPIWIPPTLVLAGWAAQHLVSLWYRGAHE